MPKPEPSDDVDFEIGFYESILKEKGDFIEALIALGDLYTRVGRYEEGLDIDRRLSRLRPEDPVVLYNLSCSYSLLGDVEKSFAAMKLAIACGYDDFAHLERDADLKNLRSHPPFEDFISQFRKKKVKGQSRGA